MSIYSGFATRQQETTYNKFMFKTLQIMAEEISGRKRGPTVYKDGDSVSNMSINYGDGFEKKIVKCYKALRYMEESKHLEPKFSQAFRDLAK